MRRGGHKPGTSIHLLTSYPVTGSVTFSRRRKTVRAVTSCCPGAVREGFCAADKGARNCVRVRRPVVASHRDVKLHRRRRLFRRRWRSADRGEGEKKKDRPRSLDSNGVNIFSLCDLPCSPCRIIPPPQLSIKRTLRTQRRECSQNEFR